MVPENKLYRRYKQINFTGLQNNLHPSQHTTGRSPPYSLDLAPDQGSTVDFFLFPRLKSIMKGTSFADVAAIQERVTVVLRSIPLEAFADSFQKLYVCCQQCVVKDGGYFEGQ
jgi:hypothetical protein